MNIMDKIAYKLKLISEIDMYRKMGAKIGNNTKFYNVRLDRGHCYLIEIGKECTLTNCTILAHDASTQKCIHKSRVGRVQIGDRCFIGLGSIILPNVKIGNDCIIRAGSVVTKDIPNNSVVAGNPARIVGTMDEFEKKHEKYIKEKPVFNTYWKHKTCEEKNKEIEQLKDTFGYDE